jgi:hypothetical protein
MIVRLLTSAKTAVVAFTAAILLVYALLPLGVTLLALDNPYLIELAGMTVVAGAAIAFGYKLPLFDQRFEPNAIRIRLEATTFHVVIWAAFFVYLITTFATAEAVPIISAFKGAEPAELSQQRGDFLKARVGLEVVLLYLGTIFLGGLLPYSLARMFLDKAPCRFLATGLFLAFSISFLAKSLFLNVALPLLYVFAQRNRASVTGVLFFLLTCVSLLYAVTLLSFGFESEFETSERDSDAFFSAGYLPTGPVDHLIWRAISVPMFTAADSLLVFAEQFDRRSLMGATSSFVAGLFSLERIPFEKLVFEEQWNWNEIGNSNAVYIAEAFVNFGWFGVVGFSIFVGQSLRWFSKSRDEAFKALWMVYCFTLFSGGLIGTLLSTGYAIVFAFAIFFRVSIRETPLAVANSTAVNPEQPVKRARAAARAREKS